MGDLETHHLVSSEFIETIPTFPDIPVICRRFRSLDANYFLYFPIQLDFSNTALPPALWNRDQIPPFLVMRSRSGERLFDNALNEEMS